MPNSQNTNESDLQILGLIPARGGSKGVPRKNVRLLAGKPLLHYTCEAALDSCHLTRTIVSTDCNEIARVATDAGVPVPFLRPAELAGDRTPTIDVVRHALFWLMDQENYQPDIIVLLQPTAPLRTCEHIDDAIRLLSQENADSVVSVTAVPKHYHPLWQLTMTSGRLRLFGDEPLSKIVTRRQDLPPSYFRNGAVYAFWRRTIESGSLYGQECLGYEMSERESINIDTLEDFERAERALSGQEVLRAAG